MKLTRAQFLRLLAAAGLAPAALAAPSSELHVVQWSDIHWGSDQDDAPAWKEALERGLDERPDALLMTGDHGDNASGRGDFAERQRSFWKETVPFLPSSTPLLLCLGNSDFRRNYQTDPETLAETAEIYQECLGDRYYLDELGNGRRRALGRRWISLNTQIFSPKNRYAGSADQARLTLDRLAGWLSDGSEPVILLLHIPPIYDLYSNDLAWWPRWISALWKILDRSSAPLRIVSGHFHRNEIHAYRRPGGVEIPLLVGGSLSRKYDYQPNWRSHRWSSAGTRSLVHYPGHPDWKSEYRWRGLEEIRVRLGQPEFLAGYVRDLFARHAEMTTRPERYREEILGHLQA